MTFVQDRDERGKPLELLMAQAFHDRGIPFGFNPYSETEDPRREDFDLYTGTPEAATLWEVKMDWLSALTGNCFIEEKTLRNTKAQKFAVGRLFIDVFDTTRLLEMYAARSQGMYLYKHVIGGDQPENHGMLLDWKAIKANSRPFWMELREKSHKLAA